MYKKFFLSSLALTALCLHGLAGLAGADQADSVQSSGPGHYYQNSTIINGDVHIDNSGTGSPGFAGTWQDPESGDIMTSVIAPRQPATPYGHTHLYVAPFMGNEGYDGGYKPDDRWPGKHHRPHHGPYPGLRPGGHHGPHGIPPYMGGPGRPPQMMPGRPGIPPMMEPGMHHGLDMGMGRR